MASKLTSLPAGQQQDVYNQLIPDEGPKALVYNLDFSLADSIIIPGLQLAQMGKFSMIQTIYVDLSLSTKNVTFLFEGGQIITAKARTQGYYSVICTNPFNVTATCVGGGIIPIRLINVPIAGAVWTAF
jgi:hypothetical protein